MSEQRFVVAVVTVADEQGAQGFLRYYGTPGLGHADVAREAFRSLSRATVRVLDIETFDGPPRRWDPRHDVEERT